MARSTSRLQTGQEAPLLLVVVDLLDVTVLGRGRVLFECLFEAVISDESPQLTDLPSRLIPLRCTVSGVRVPVDYECVDAARRAIGTGRGVTRHLEHRVLNTLDPSQVLGL